MGKIILVTGGSRSGKSGYAQRRAEAFRGPKLFVATCPRIDIEITKRIDRHIRERRGRGWDTLEEQCDVAAIIKTNTYPTVILVDCLTLWVNNLLYNNSQKNKGLTEDDVTDLCEQVLEECRRHSATIIFVTNEIGSGIVPESADSRLYRDLVGRCNQCIATEANEVILVTCGIPLVLKSD